MDADVDDEDTPEDVAHIVIISKYDCRALDLPEWQHHTQSRIILLNKMKLITISIDKISQYLVLLPELCWFGYTDICYR